jgi:hypothetical protein
MSQDSQGLGSSQSDKKTGTCPTCQVAGIRLTRGGLLYNHGPRGAHCGGKGALPVSIGKIGHMPISHTVQQPSQLLSPTSSQGVSGLPVTTGLQTSSSGVPVTTGLQSSSVLLNLNSSLPPMIKWIPRAARQHCASLLCKIIQGVISMPNNSRSWEHLLAFG